MLKVKSFNTNSHGKEAVIYSAVNTWNSLQKQLKHFLLRNLSTFQLKSFLKLHYLKNYQDLHMFHVSCLFDLNICIFCFLSSLIP